MPQTPEWRASRSRSCAVSPTFAAAARCRFGRWKLATKVSAASIRSARRMSSRVRGSAVAVSAMRGTPGNCSARHARLAVFRAELVAPLRDAMRLVDREQRELQARQPLQRAVRQQPLRRDVEQIELLLDQVARDAARLGRIEFRMQRAGGDAELAQRRDLIVHQRDQRRDHHRGAGPAQRRHLVADALAAAGRHQHQRVAAGDDMAHHLLLLAAKARESRTPGAARLPDRPRPRPAPAIAACDQRRPMLISTRRLSCAVSANCTEPWPRWLTRFGSTPSVCN